MAGSRRDDHGPWAGRTRLAGLGLTLCLTAGAACDSETGASATRADATADSGSGAAAKAVEGLGPLQVSVADRQVTLSWPEDEWPHHCVVIQQAVAGKPVDLSLCTKESGQRQVVLGPEAGKNGADYAFSATQGLQVGTATWSLRGGDDYWGVTPKVIASGKARLGPHFSGPCSTADTQAKGLIEWHAKAPVTLDVSVTLGQNARAEVPITTPEIWVDTVQAKGNPQKGGTLQFSYTLDTPGMYTVEVNNSGGGAILNCGIYVGADLPLVAVEKGGGAGLQAQPTAAQLESFRKKLLDLLNAERAKVKLPSLTLDDTLNKMAQYHSDDMSAKDYFAHDAPNGETLGDRAKQFGWSKGVGENIASNGSPEGAHNGLYWSAGHRANMLGKWTVVGFGVAKAAKGTNMLVTQNFGE
jgi:hypothetical protein